MLLFFKNIITICSNAIYSLTTSHTTMENDKQYVESLVKHANFNMSEVRHNTEIALKSHKTDYAGITSYMAGNSWLNSKLSTGQTLCGIDLNIYDSINRTVGRVKPLSYPITLFHGFELFTQYNESTWNIGKTIVFPWFLSKTPSYDVANKFASAYDKYQPKFMVVSYPAGSKHIGLDIRPHDEEFEYLSKSDEKLKLVRICRIPRFPYMYVFYIFKSRDYLKSQKVTFAE